MENNKYYTPTIEEFHVGFEFQTFYRTGWKNHEVLITTDLNNINRIIEKEDTDFDIRVKYLDEEDIESLGFKFDNYTFVKGNIKIYLNREEELPRVKIQNSNKISGIVFDLVIRNKSELIKELKRVEITK